MMDNQPFIAVSRFGLGGGPEEVKKIQSDPKAWLKGQITTSPALPDLLARFRSSEAILTDIHQARAESRAAFKKTMKKVYREDFAAEVFARTRHLIETNTPFAERMLLFWSNHFTVSTTKRITGAAIPAFEREAIRPHLFGRFSDMLIHVSRHPVMLSYLDNATSMGELSPAGRRRRDKRGLQQTLNENLAREILELHTLGVNGGYTQKDVIELAKAISGWSHGGINAGRRGLPPSGTFEFKSIFHEPGPKTVLGKTYKEEGEREGLRILLDLASHTSTAVFLAHKLVRHFVDDNPPEAAVRKIATVFLKSGGDLAQVSAALIDLEEAWSAALSKTKNHYEFLISVYRATAERNLKMASIAKPLGEFGQMPFTAASPAGWGDRTLDWLAPETLMRRIEWVRQHARSLSSNLNPLDVIDNLLGPLASENTRMWVSRAPSGDAALAMIFASPEFQRR